VRTGSLRREVVLSLFVVMLATLGLLSAVLGGLAARSVQRHALERLADEARELERLGTTGSGRLVDLAVVAGARRSRAQWQVLDAGGRLVGVGPVPEQAPPELHEFRSVLVSGPEVRGGLLDDALWLARPVLSGRAERGVLVGRVAHQELWSELTPLLGSGAWVFASGALAFVGFGSYLLGRRLVRPLRAVTDAAARVATGDLSARVEVIGPEEVSELAASFNHMASALAGEREALGRARESLDRSRRLAAVGQLAAGVAHEVGNPVAAILGFAEAIERDRHLPEGSRARELAGRIREEAMRVRARVRELLDLARPHPVELERIEVARWLGELAERLGAQPRFAHLRIQVCCPEPIPELRTDRRRAEQILLNFVENAAHALAGCGGSLELGAAPERSLRERRRRGDSTAAEAPDAVALSVVDDGPGIDPEHLPLVFDPFFTTKAPGEGSGLGLWNAHRLAERLGGRIEAESRPGATRFSLVLPCADTPSTDGAPPDPDRR
jgi:signal transduction histidine kinase